MIPQMALGGAMFSFDKLNRILGSPGKVPLIAEFMVSRWSYESLMVNQFINNRYQKVFYEVEKDKANSNYKQVYYYPELRNIISESLELMDNVKNDSVKLIVKDNFTLLKNELNKESMRLPSLAFKEYQLLEFETFDEEAANKIDKHIELWDNYYSKIYSKADLNDKKSGYTKNLMRKYNNDKLQDIVYNSFEKNNILRSDDNLIRQNKPIYDEPDNFGNFSFRTHFYAPHKVLFGKYIETYWFNVTMIWLMSILLYIPLYFDHLKKLLNFFENIQWTNIIFWKKKK